MDYLGNYKNLDVWKTSMELVKEVYNISSMFPKDERFALKDQINRAVVSVPSNIAEGKGRQSKDEFKQFLFIAKGSLYEVDTQLNIAIELGYIDYEQAKQAFELITRIDKMLTKLTQYLKQ